MAEIINIVDLIKERGKFRKLNNDLALYAGKLKEISSEEFDDSDVVVQYMGAFLRVQQILSEIGLLFRTKIIGEASEIRGSITQAKCEQIWGEMGISSEDMKKFNVKIDVPE